MPLVVLSKTEPFPVPACEKGFSPARLQAAWNQTQNELPALEPGTPHMIATGSDHYIQVREPRPGHRRHQVGDRPHPPEVGDRGA
jgi:hypothetical protein